MTDILSTAKVWLQNVPHELHDRVPKELREVVGLLVRTVLTSTLYPLDVPYPIAFRNTQVLDVLDLIGEHFPRLRPQLDAIRAEDGFKTCSTLIAKLLAILLGKSLFTIFGAAGRGM